MLDKFVAATDTVAHWISANPKTFLVIFTASLIAVAAL